MYKLLKFHNTTAYHGSIIRCKIDNFLKRRNNSSSFPRIRGVAIEMLVSPYRRCMHVRIGILELKRQMRGHIKLCLKKHTSAGIFQLKWCYIAVGIYIR